MRLPPCSNYARRPSICKAKGWNWLHYRLLTPIQGRTIDLDGLYEGLKPGKALAVSGLRAGSGGEHTGEVAILAAVTVDAAARSPH